MRPKFITEREIARWDENINNDPNLPEGFADVPSQREVCYAGLWLYEELYIRGFPREEIEKLQIIAGVLSQKHDTWEVHQMLINETDSKGN